MVGGWRRESSNLLNYLERFLNHWFGITITVILLCFFGIYCLVWIFMYIGDYNYNKKMEDIKLYSTYPEAYEYYANIHNETVPEYISNGTDDSNKINTDVNTNNINTSTNSNTSYKKHDEFVGALEYVGKIEYNDLNTFLLVRDPEYGGEYYVTTKGQLVPRTMP